MSTDGPRLIEVAFPLKQASLDAVHEKNVRHGHISTLHIWPARRPLAACRAALIATLLSDPGNAEERKRILERLAGKVVETTKYKKMPNGKVDEVVTEETVGGILHWGRESGPDLDWFRAKIREAYGGRAPKVLDPFAGGGAIPLEAMRLGCEATAIDINPVAWFILKCTLEYPQKLAGQKRPLPSFALRDREFMEGFFKAQGLKGAVLRAELKKLGIGDQADTEMTSELPGMAATPVPLDGDLAWHVRAWGRWVLERARADLERFYPLVDAKPTVAYLWARTVKCKHCRAMLPLLKTRWLCKKESKRVVLTMDLTAGKSGAVFGIQTDVPVVGTSAAQRREYDRRIGGGTMSRSGATCPCCGGIVTMQDIRLEGRDGRLGAVMTAVVVEGGQGKEYRPPVDEEPRLADQTARELSPVFAHVPFGIPEETTPAGGGSGAGRAFSVQGYGLMRWRDLFLPRQLLSLGVLVDQTRSASDAIRQDGYPTRWAEAIGAYLASLVDKIATYNSSLCIWHNSRELIAHTLSRFALPITWDFAELAPTNSVGSAYGSHLDWTGRYVDHALRAFSSESRSAVLHQSATVGVQGLADVVVTDPPYYDAIPYSDLADFFYVWLRRAAYGLSSELDEAFSEPLGPKWDQVLNDGELIDDDSRFGRDKAKSRGAYEEGMLRSFQACHKTLEANGRMVVVFANKHPSAWETLVSAIVRAGFVVDGSWPIMTEMRGGVRNLNRASLSSSVWLVCKKRADAARPGWDNRVLEEMRDRITTRLRDFWDAGIRGPDFVWAATGPALEAYSKHPIVKKADEPGKTMDVSEFLRHVRRIVVDFVVGRVLAGNGNSEAVTGLDDVTTYYLLHRHDFKMDDAPAGACILYAISCGLSDRTLVDQYDLLVRTGGQEAAEEDEADEADGEIEEGTGSKMKLKNWHQRKRRGMGYEAFGGRPVPLIDQVHRLMFLWKAGDQVEVSEYLDSRGLRRSALFRQLLQALIELADAGSEERSLLESISNYLGAKAAGVGIRQGQMEGI